MACQVTTSDIAVCKTAIARNPRLIIRKRRMVHHCDIDINRIIQWSTKYSGTLQLKNLQTHKKIPRSKD